MKFTVSVGTMLNGLLNVSGVITSNQTLPILECFLLELEPGKLKIYGSDVRTTIRTQIEVESENSGKIAVPAPIFIETFKNLPDQDVEISVDLEKSAIEIIHFSGEARLVGYKGEEYPKMPEIDRASTFDVPGGILTRGIGKVAFSTGIDELRPAICGIFFSINEEGLSFVATNGHRIAIFTRKDFTQEKETSFVLPKRPLTVIKGLLSDSDTVAVSYNETNVSFSAGEIIMVCRLVEGKFPPYKMVMPKESNKTLTINRLGLLSSLKRVVLFADKVDQRVRFSCGPEFSIQSEDLDFSTKSNERINAAYEGENIEIGFNSKYLIELLPNFEGVEVKILLSESNKGVIFKEVTSPENEDLTILAMPLKLANVSPAE